MQKSRLTKVNELPPVYKSWSEFFETIMRAGGINLLDAEIKKVSMEIRPQLGEGDQTLPPVEYVVYASFLKSRVLEELLKSVDGLTFHGVKSVTQELRVLYFHRHNHMAADQDRVLRVAERLVRLRTGGSN